MALPAGRYGVTKNQLLKIKKLPMNTIKLIEELTEKFNLLGTAAFKNSTSVVTESSDLVESGAVYTALQGKADNSVIGTVEGANASKAWSVGEHFIRNGKFCTVTQAISSGGTLTEGTNYTAGDVAGELDIVDITNLCSFNTDSAWNTTWTHVYKQGRHIFGTLRFTTPSSVTADKAAMALPSAYVAINNQVVGVANKIWDGSTSGVLGMNNNNGVIRFMSTGWLPSTEIISNISAYIK